MKSVFLYVKIGALVFALSGVFYATQHLNPQAVANALAAFGIQAGTAESPGFQAAGHPSGDASGVRIPICPTRIQEIITPDGRRIFESTESNGRLKWSAFDSAPHEISALEIEKWLSLHCQINAVPVAQNSAQSGVHVVYKIAYPSGDPLEIARVNDSYFVVKGQTFKSEDLRQALKDLENIGFPAGH
jgi:hypothetical protein